LIHFRDRGVFKEATTRERISWDAIRNPQSEIGYNRSCTRGHNASHRRRHPTQETPSPAALPQRDANFNPIRRAPTGHVSNYDESNPAVDARRVTLIGHSRLGKTVLWAGARDPRFALVFSSCAGEIGSSLARRGFGETVATWPPTFPGNFDTADSRVRGVGQHGPHASRAVHQASSRRFRQPGFLRMKQSFERELLKGDILCQHSFGIVATKRSLK
jgi:hypothetical protein